MTGRQSGFTFKFVLRIRIRSSMITSSGGRGKEKITPFGIVHTHQTNIFFGIDTDMSST